MSTIVLAQGGAGGILQSLMSGLTTIVSYIPSIIGALVILLVGYIVAKILQKVFAKGLQKAGVDRRMEGSQVQGYMNKMSSGMRASGLIGRVVFWLVMFFVIVAAVGALQIPAVTMFMNQLLSYLPNIIAALIIFAIAALLASAIGGIVRRTMGDTATGRIVATVAPGLVMAIAVFMILSQLRIAPSIVQITYAALIGAAALGLALAFGLGGREVAGDMLRTGYRKAQEQQGQVAQDTRVAQERGQRDVEESRARAESESESGAHHAAETPTQRYPGPAGS